MKTARKMTLLLVIAILALPISALAREDGAPTSALGMADAIRSNASGISGLYFNPAGMSQMFLYSLESGYTFDNLVRAHIFNASIVDSATNRNVGLGFGYTYTKSELQNGNKREGHGFRFALSTGYRAKKWGIFAGLAMRYLRLEVENTYKINALAADVGALLAFDFGLRIGIVGYNLTSVKNEEFRRSLGTGISYQSNDFIIAFDALVDFQTKSKPAAKWSWGLEYMIKKIAVVRGGFQLDQVNDRKLLSLGTGFVTRYVGMDIAYQQDVSNKRGYVLSAVIKGFLP